MVGDANGKGLGAHRKVESVVAGNILKRRDMEHLGRVNGVGRTYGSKSVAAAEIAVALPKCVVDLGNDGKDVVVLEDKPEADGREPVAKQARLGQKRDRRIRAQYKTGLRKSRPRPRCAIAGAPLATMIAVVDGQEVEPIAREQSGPPCIIGRDQEVVGIVSKAVPQIATSRMGH